MDGGLGSLEVERDDAGDAGPGQPAPARRRIDQCLQRLGGRARTRRRPRAPAPAGDRRAGSAPPATARWVTSNSSSRLDPPRRAAADRSHAASPASTVRRTGSPSSSRAMMPLASPGLARVQPARRRVQGDAEAVVAGGGDRRPAMPSAAAIVRAKRIGAMMAAEQRHHGRAVLGHRQHRRLACLVTQCRGHRADQDAARAQADDGQCHPRTGHAHAPQPCSKRTSAAQAAQAGAWIRLPGSSARSRSARAAPRGPRVKIAMRGLMRAGASGRR